MQVQYYNITGLTPYQLITVTITAINGAGTSEPSNEVSGRTHEAGMIILSSLIHSYKFSYHILHTAPGDVEIVDIGIISDTTATVVWDPPIQPNGIITSYEVIYSVYEDNNNSIAVPVTSNISSFNVTDLCKLKL